MSQAIRILLIVVAVLCVPAIVSAEGLTSSRAQPMALMLITGTAAIVWPSTRKTGTDESRWERQ